MFHFFFESQDGENALMARESINFGDLKCAALLARNAKEYKSALEIEVVDDSGLVLYVTGQEKANFKPTKKQLWAIQRLTSGVNYIFIENYIVEVMPRNSGQHAMMITFEAAPISWIEKKLRAHCAYVVGPRGSVKKLYDSVY
jgi:hypothetical protein